MMPASVEYRQEDMSSGKTEAKEKGNELSLFLDFSRPNPNLDLLQKSNKFQEALDSESENPLMLQTRSIIHGPGADDLLDSENNATDYDWLLSPPRNPLLSLEMEEQINLTSLISNGRSTSPDSRPENPPADSTSTTNVATRLPASSIAVKSSSGAIRRSSPIRKVPSTGYRSATPTTQAIVPSTAKPLRSSTPKSRATVAAMKPVAPSKRSTTPTSSSARSSTPTPRPSILAAASKSKSRSSTPTPRPSIIAASKSTSRSSTPTARPSVVATSKSTSRSSTPTQRPSNPSGLLSTSVNGGRSSSVTKARVPSVKNPAASRGSSPSVKSRPSKNPTEMPPGFATEAPPNIKKSMPERPASASRGRPGLDTVKLPMNEYNSKAIPKRSSCSPSRGQVSTSSANNSVKSGPTRGRGYTNGNDDVNPVLIGTKMVERVVNMRKLAPPKQDYISNQSNTSGKLTVSQDNSGFGRTLSKKSFDMALRHLDIRRSMPGNMRAMITKVPASSVYSVRSESTKTQTISASDSPLATSSSASSEQGIGHESSFVDGKLATEMSENGHPYHHDQ